jgi:hypothetical protein
LNFKQVLGVLAIIIGIAMLIFVMYGRRQLDDAKDQISSAKKKVSQSNDLFSLTPITKQFGQGMTSGAQKKIAAGERTVEQYETMFMWTQIGGIGLIVIGGGLVLFCRTNKKRAR